MKQYDDSYIDVIIEILRKKLIRAFNKAKKQNDFDELNALETSHEVYDELLEFVKRQLLKLAQNVCRQLGYKDEWLDMMWLEDYLVEVGYITHYRFSFEWERKRERFAEALMSNENLSRELRTARNLLARQIEQACIDITDRVQEEASAGDETLKGWIWHTAQDERVCVDCNANDGKFFRKYPKRPHYGCRCTFERVEKKI